MTSNSWLEDFVDYTKNPIVVTEIKKPYGE